MSGPTWQLNFNMEKIKQNKEVVIVVTVILVFVFYWFQLRPTAIKKNCSWLTQMEKGRPEIPAFPGITKEEADRKNAECRSSDSAICKMFVSVEMPPRPAVPAEPDAEVTRAATKSEYDQCLRQNGL